MTTDQGVSQSEFYMWRAVFAFSLTDNTLTIEEQELLRSYLNNVNFSQPQKAILKEDLQYPANVEELYARITEPEHKSRFCALARALVWCEGDMDRQEEQILKRVGCLKKSLDDMDILKNSRHHLHLEDYYQHYARAGVMGMSKPSAGYRASI